MTNFEMFLEDVRAERQYQLEKWSEEFDSRNTANDWCAYILRHLGQSVTYPWDAPTFRKQLVKVAALCGAAIDWLDRTNGNLAKRHYD